MQIDSKLSPVEELKASSNLLRGTIAEELAAETDHFASETVQLLKHHGMYQQDNRDARSAGRAAGETGKRFMLMVRTPVTGGRLTSEQLLAELDLCDRFGNGTLRVTSRQALQLHGVLKADARDVVRQINAVHLSTLAACGDVNRNVMCCPAPYADDVQRELQSLARQLAAHFAPRTRAYHEIWLRDPLADDKQLVDGGEPDEEVEPIYGATYLPRKFKMGIALPHDNCIDVHAQDLGFLAIVEHGRVVGYNLLVGGGMGVTPSNKRTYAALGKRLAFVESHEAVQVAEAIVKVQRDFGNREDRKLARLKYLVDRWGLDTFRAKVEEYCGHALQDARPIEVTGTNDHIGWESQGDGRWCYGLNIENGRIADTTRMQLKTALRQVCRELTPGLRLTAHQSILVTDLSEAQRPRLEAILRAHAVPLSEDISTVRRWSMACVAWPTCGLAITESERALPGVIDALEAELARQGLSREAFTVRMTGCPNGCARPYNADVGLVGKARGRYTVFLGGTRLGTRLNFVYEDLVPTDGIVPLLAPLLTYYRATRRNGESFGDFCHRKGPDDLRARAAEVAAVGKVDNGATAPQGTAQP